MFKIAKSKLPELLKAIAAQQELFLPVNNNGQVNFAAWFEGCNADIETLKTVKSPKDMFFPQSETLYTVKKGQHKLSVEPQTLADQNFVAFGMKACDIQGIKVLDKVFLAEPVDTFYRARREHGTMWRLLATSRRSPASVRFSALTALSRTPMSSCGTQTTRSTGKL